MNRVPVHSSHIKDIEYQEVSMRLVVGFLDGSVYVYHGVPKVLHEKLMAAGSKGSFLAAKIKGTYRHERVR